MSTRDSLNIGFDYKSLLMGYLDDFSDVQDSVERVEAKLDELVVVLQYIIKNMSANQVYIGRLLKSQGVSQDLREATVEPEPVGGPQQ